MNIEIKDEYTYEEIEEMVATIVGWFSVGHQYTEDVVEEYREHVAIFCEELATLVRRGCMPLKWNEDEQETRH